MYGLENLSSIDFEDLCRDLAKALTENRFEAFGPGPDGGIDGRYATSSQTTILQAKHYFKADFASLLKAIRGEAKKMEKLKPERYILITSHSLTPAKKDRLMEGLRGLQVASGDILGREDIGDLLRENSDILKAHVKLWLSSTAVLERVLNSGLEAFTEATRDEILDNLRLYVRNESFDDAVCRLEEHKVLIIAGAPGVGKTTLARILTYRYLEQGWQFYAIDSLEKGFARIDRSKPTVFFFDDFLGRVELNRQALHQHDSALARFVRRVRKSTNLRFLLTTRAHIFEEAKLISDYVDESNVQLTTFLLDVGQYTRRVRAHILFNHLVNSGLTEEHFSELLKGDWIKKIVDHENYNPRVVSMVTSSRITRVDPKDFPADVLAGTKQPRPHMGKAV